MAIAGAIVLLSQSPVTANFRRRRQTDDLPRGMALAFTGLFYAGNLSANRDLLAVAAIDTDDRRRPLALPDLPLAQSPAVRVRLLAGASGCWETVRSAPARRNDVEQFLDTP